MSELDTNFTIYVSEKHYQHLNDVQNKNSYQYFAKKFVIDNITLFTITVLIGKYVINKKEKVERGATFIKWGSAEKTDELIILKALAVEEVGDVSVLENQELMTSIWEEYAMAGMVEFCNWARDNSIDLQSKIEDVMTEFHDKNMLVL